MPQIAPPGSCPLGRKSAGCPDDRNMDSWVFGATRLPDATTSSSGSAQTPMAFPSTAGAAAPHAHAQTARAAAATAARNPPPGSPFSAGGAAAVAATTAPPHAPQPPPRSKPLTNKGVVKMVRRRNRLITSCLECRRRKLRCDKLAPCTNCVRIGEDCLYLAREDGHAQQKLADMKERMGALERNLEREAAAAATGGRGRSRSRLGSKDESAAGSGNTPDDPYSDDDDDFAAAHEDEEGLESTPFAAWDNVYETNGDDGMMDLGIQMGKVRISERLGGWIRPRLAEELDDTLSDLKARLAKQQQQQQQQSAASGSVGGHEDLHGGARAAAAPPQPRLQAALNSYFGPSPDYIAPSSSLFFRGPHLMDPMFSHPSRHAADLLLNQYWDAVHYLCKIVHRPSFEAQYQVFWSSVQARIEPVPPVQAIIFAALFSAAVSMTPEDTMRLFGKDKTTLVDELRAGTERALAKAHFLQTTKLDTIQAFVMYLIPFVRAEVSRAHSALVGTAIRLAECMGLHRDGTLYGLGAVETQVRRLIWHQLSFLDMRTCEATGPRPQIRKEDYDTKLPWNVDDVDLLGPHPVTQDQPGWTDTTFARMRAECMEMRRTVWFDVLAVDRKKKTLTALLVKVQKFRAAVEARLLPRLDPAVPFHRLTRLVFEIHCATYHLQCLHRYLFMRTHRMPDRLRQVLIEAGLSQMESGIAFETTPELRKWVWYEGAFHQFHCALLLLVEIYSFPMRKEARRIWRCLDYIFEIPSHLAPKDKAELVLLDFRERMKTYQESRKPRISTALRSHIAEGHQTLLRPPPEDPVDDEKIVAGVGAVVDASGQMMQQGSDLPPPPPMPSGQPGSVGWAAPMPQVPLHPNTESPEAESARSTQSGGWASTTGPIGAGTGVENPHMTLEEIECDWVGDILPMVIAARPTPAQAAPTSSLLRQAPTSFSRNHHHHPYSRYHHHHHHPHEHTHLHLRRTRHSRVRKRLTHRASAAHYHIKQAELNKYPSFNTAFELDMPNFDMAEFTGVHQQQQQQQQQQTQHQHQNQHHHQNQQQQQQQQQHPQYTFAPPQGQVTTTTATNLSVPGLMDPHPYHLDATTAATTLADLGNLGNLGPLGGFPMTLP